MKAIIKALGFYQIDMDMVNKYGHRIKMEIKYLRNIQDFGILIK